MSDESVLYTVARESTPLVALGDGWRAPAGTDTNEALSAAVEAARAFHKKTRGEHHVVREQRVRNQGGVRSERTVFSTRINL